MSKKLIKNSVIYTLGDFIGIAVSGFLLLPFYTRFLTKMEFGTFSIINASITILTFIIHFGIISAYSRLYFNQQDEREKKIFTGQIILLHFFIIFTLLFFLIIFQSFFSKIFFTSVNNTTYYYYVLLLSGMNFLTSLYGVYLRLNEEAEKFFAFQITTVVLQVVFIFTFKLWIVNILDAILLATFISSMIMWCISFLSIRYILIIDNIFTAIKNILHFALPMFVGYLMYFLLNKFSTLYLQTHDTIENIALFSFAMQLSTILSLLAASVGKAIQPILFKLEKHQILGEAKRISFYYKIILTLVFFIFFIFSEFIISIFAPSSYLESKELFVILLISTLIYNFRSTESLLFLYFNKPRYSLYIVSIGALFVLMVSYSIVPIYGTLGSALAILAGSMATYLSSIYYETKLLREECNK